MKKVLLTVMTMLLVCTLFVLLASCGGETESTTADSTNGGATTTAPGTNGGSTGNDTPAGTNGSSTGNDTPAGTNGGSTGSDTPAGTNGGSTGNDTPADSQNNTVTTAPDATPDEIAPAGTDFNKVVGKRFDFAYSVSGYWATEYNAVGSPISRTNYSFDSMMQVHGGAIFKYGYDSKGRITSFSAKMDESIGFIDFQVNSDKNGHALSAVGTGEYLDFKLVWGYDERGVLSSEAIYMDGVEGMVFTFDANGRIVKEAFVAGMSSSKAVTLITYTDSTAKASITYEGMKMVDVTVTFNKEGYPVKMAGILQGEEGEVTYTYNEKNLCTEAITVTAGETSKYKATYDAAGRVKTVQSIRVEDGKDIPNETSEYEYDAKGNTTKETKIVHNPDGGVGYKSVRESAYDENNRKTMESWAYYDGQDNLSEKEAYEYTYDAKGRVIKRTETITDSKGNVGSKTVYEYAYDENDKKTMESYTHYDSKGNVDSKEVTEYTYDAKGNCIKETHKRYNSEGVATETRVQEYTYNDKGIHVKTDETHYEGTTLIHKETREYDEKGNVIKEIDYHTDKDGTLGGRTERISEYDDDGMRTKMTEINYDADGKQASKFVYEYEFSDGEEKYQPIKDTVTEYDAEDKFVSKTVREYDEYGNPIKMTVYDENGNVISSTDNPGNEAVRPDDPNKGEDSQHPEKDETATDKLPDDDKNNNGIPDHEENFDNSSDANVDKDNDGIPDNNEDFVDDDKHADKNGNGIPDSEEKDYEFDSNNSSSDFDGGFSTIVPDDGSNGTVTIVPGKDMNGGIVTIVPGTSVNGGTVTIVPGAPTDPNAKLEFESGVLKPAE